MTRERAPRKPLNWPILVFFVVAIGILAYRSMSGGVAPTPPAFESKTTLSDAIDQATASGKPVLAFATADWCGPCQSFKRGALADASVAALIAERTEPAYVDLTNTNTPEAAQAGQFLRIGPIPTLVMLDEGREIGRLEGSVGAGQLKSWLEESLARVDD